MLRKLHYITFLSLFLLFSVGKVQAFTADDISNTKVDTTIVNAHWEQADKYVKLGEADRAFAAIDAAFKVIKMSNDAQWLYKILRRGGSIAEEFNRLDVAKRYYGEVLTITKSLSSTQQFDIFMDWAIVHKKSGDYSISKEYYTKALETAENTNQLDKVSYALNGLATLHSTFSDFEKSIEYYQKAIQAAEKIKDTEGVLIYTRNMARLDTKINNFDLALKNGVKAYDIALKSKDSTEIAMCLVTIGKILTAQNKPEAALPYHLQALTFMKAVHYKQSQIEILQNVADAYLQLGELDASEKYYKQCLALENYLSGYFYADFYYKLGKLYGKKRESQKAIDAYEKCLNSSITGNYKDLIQKSSEALAKTFEQKNNLPQAYKHLKTAQAYADTLFNEEKNRQLIEAQFKFDVKRSEQQVQDLQVRQSRYVLLFGVGILMVVLLSVLYNNHQNRKNLELLRRKTVEIQLQNRRLEESNEILQQFAYASAHDLKEPLRSISSFTSIIARRYLPLLPPEASDYMNFVTAGVKRMEKLLSALLEYSTVAAENQIVTQAIPVSQVLDDVKKNLNATIMEKGALVQYNNSLPSLFVSRLHLTQLLQNLIGNALKFTNNTPIVEIATKQNAEHLLIAIKDNGIGMKKDHSDKIFRLFQRLDRDPRYEGTGIGLTICKNIVEKYDGKIWCESEEGVGTTFFIELPNKVVQQETAQFTEGGVKRELAHA
jgi:signal transduction histidine kinase